MIVDVCVMVGVVFDCVGGDECVGDGVVGVDVGGASEVGVVVRVRVRRV